jgi:16S rRNA (cytosine967-C5)-methyltransferase
MTITITPTRVAAFDILLKIQRNQGHCDELLRTRQVEVLPPLDRNLCTNLVMGTLRWQSALDEHINASLRRPDNRLSDEVRIALRLGAFQRVSN